MFLRLILLLDATANVILWLFVSSTVRMYCSALPGVTGIWVLTGLQSFLLCFAVIGPNTST